MSQAGIIDLQAINPNIPTEFVTDDGTAIPIANVLEILGTSVPAGITPVKTTGSGNTVTIEVQITSSSPTPDSTLNGLSHFDSADFIVDSDGFVSLNGTGNMVWETISANQTLEVNHGSICVSPGGNLDLELPATATLGDIIEITLDGATSWTITQAAGQQIRYNNLETTLGASGSIATTDAGNTIRMVAQSATRWNILSALGTLIVT